MILPNSKRPGGWLLWTMAAAFVAAYVSVKLSKLFLSNASEGVTNVVKPAIFSGVGATVFTWLGMRAFSDKIRGLRRHTKE